MSEDDQAEWIVPTTGAKTLPVIEILTGRGFITGKSGSGKSNTASVIAEELLDNNYNLLVVDPEGEYYGLKEDYEILHVGNDDLCDVQVTPNHAEKLAEIALNRNMPIILDVSDYLDGDEASALIAEVVRALFQKEKDVRKPFLLMIEEMQEYLPQQGGNDELSDLLERIAKRGRKRGLGMLGMTQRPSSVDKEFITQCDWMVWHRLTWQNDIDVVRNVLGSEIADEVEDLDTGEGYLMTDWDEAVDRVHFKRKRTHDAGATPGLESYERPPLKSVSEDLLSEIRSTDPDSDYGDSPSSATVALDATERAELDDVVETIEAESGIATSDEKPSRDTVSSGKAAADQLSDSSGTTSDAGIAARTAAEQLIAGLDGQETAVDIASLSEEEIQTHIETLLRRNRILEDEVKELRSILQAVETDGNSQDRTKSTTRPDSQTGGAPATGRSGEYPTQEDDDPQAPTVSKPVPPDPPVERAGIAGNIVEFVAMLAYLTRSMLYRCRLLVYRVRYGNGTDTGRSDVNSRT